MNYIVTAGIIMICITLAGSVSAIGVGYFCFQSGGRLLHGYAQKAVPPY